MDAGNANLRVITNNGGTYTIVDTATNLSNANFDKAGSSDDAASVTVEIQGNAENLTAIDLDTTVTAINLNGKSVVILDMGNIGTRSITAGGGTYVVRDAATNLTSIDLTAAPNNNPNAASVTAVVAANSEDLK